MTARIDTIVFDVGNVLLDWDPRHLYRKLFDDPAEMETFLAEICTPEWNVEQDRGRSWREATDLLIHEHPDKADLIQAFDRRWEETVAGAIHESVALLRKLHRADTPLYAITNFSSEKFPLVLERYPSIDGDRIGAIGSSYGGYSALMSILRNPELFRCAVSFAGVTDLTLLFNGERVRKNADLRDVLVDMIGDPSVEYEQLVEYSPVYQFRRFTRPLLIAHGTDDSVVDIEHSWRLKMMLELADIDAEFVVLDRVGHGFPFVAQAKSFYDPAIAFLDTHLKDIDSGDVSPASNPPAAAE